ncbi:clathrin light chain isoform X2 [Onthophagus taurus]|uniref:clathrin light chain isoform X2 n=1 Tax=Onthophagus taurus TaxID=166361 RepID=UPI000C2044DD|nr:clathrin light chain isoform X3 [Onthophagus taurus]
MADFGDNFDQLDVDPAAEFLAREQSELAGLEDELKPAAAVTIPPINGTLRVDGAPIHLVNENSGSSFEMIDNLEQDINLDFGKPSNGDDYSFEHDYGNTVSSSPPLMKHELKEEPEKIRKWREEQVTRLEEKDKAEEIKKEEWREVAKKELEDWYKNHAEQIAKTKAANRNAEKQFVADDNEIEPGTEWERIAKLCDFNPKAKQGSKDVSRMRSIILQLKQSPINSKA